MKPAYLFIRDDDVRTLDGYFKEFFALLLGLRLPAVYAVIPRLMDERLIAGLKRQKELTPSLLDIVQHGWAHTDHS
ncbi:MAG: hypothetical protein HQL22_08960, partial [Candidatus Omnitrophica bacterium]|nr:hypothetical protein [Candidatus Omnitrophota bacterium]